ncbi:cysteine desulfurase [Tenacibaculum sp. MAR_2009_124]|uniref:cysteine desulfurase family protein n=1 Tax=Tenacibaculum sp. MAR_2009_124 TaxID=1250059 RepID=UPI00089429BD|nr:cysteine desulfurase family protein [Tenacibaculum sp. MAR_2009_124]SEB76814.1 cysteine desulfurase [Tenacibaculum sp. MAR_2009_124]
MKTPFIYLDYNASTPIDSRVVDEMLPYLTRIYGNPSSIHNQGVKAKEAVQNARQQVANLIGANSDEIIFTSGGTEANNHAIIGTAMANKVNGNHIITSAIEHPAVTEVCKYLESRGFSISYVDVDKEGVVKLEELKKAITNETILISIMHANNEIGSIQPIEEIGKLAREKGIVFHTDASQSVGKIEAKVDQLHVDLLTIAGHKIYAPKGVGALYVRNGTKLSNLMFGAGHEQGLRPGTENVAQIVALGKATEISKEEFAKNMEQMKNIRDYLLEKLQSLNIKFVVNGNLLKCLPNTLNVSFKDLDANALIYKLRNSVALSAGSACHSGEVKLSNVVKAVLTDFDYANGTIRFSVGKSTSKKEIDEAISLFKNYFIRNL